MGEKLYFHLYLFFINFFIEFFEGVSRGGPYRWSMDRSVRWSVDPVRWTGPRTGVSVFGSPCSYGISLVFSTFICTLVRFSFSVIYCPTVIVQFVRSAFFRTSRTFLRNYSFV